MNIWDREVLEGRITIKQAVIVGVKTVVYCWLILLGITALRNMYWAEGYEITISGVTQIAQKDEERLWRYKYTHIELQSFSGEDFDLTILGHYDFEQGAAYKIVYERTSPLGHHIIMIAKIVSIERLG